MTEIDHIFLIAASQDLLVSRMKSAGFRESYRRVHTGQGTQNVCYCFDNMYVELLWVHDAAEANSAVARRTQLHTRATDPAACPFGIAYRNGLLRAPSWPYTPPYLPEGMVIQIACDSDDVRQPMIFRSPGNKPPFDNPVEKRGCLQREIGISTVNSLEFSIPHSVPICDSLQELSETSILQLHRSSSCCMRLIYEYANGSLGELVLAPVSLD